MKKTLLLVIQCRLVKKPGSLNPSLRGTACPVFTGKQSDREWITSLWLVMI